MPDTIIVPEFIVSTLPRAPLFADELGALIDHGLMERLEVSLGASMPPDRNLGPSQNKVLDDLIIKQTETLGDLALTSGVVRERLHAWWYHPDGISLTERFAAALVEAVRVHQLKSLPPLDAATPFYKDRVIQELKIALPRLRGAAAAGRKTKHRSFSIDEIKSQFRDIVRESNLGRLAGNMDFMVLLLRCPAGVHQTGVERATAYAEFLI